MNLNRDLKIVVIDCFYDALGDDYVQKFLGKLAHFKIKSYQADYPYGVLPFNSHDLIGTHYFLCEEINENLDIIMGLKALTLEQCQKYHLDFPGTALPIEAGATEHLKAVEKQIELAHSKNKKVGYTGSWAIRADVRTDKELGLLAREVTAAVFNRWIQTYNIGEMITFPVLRFKVDRFHKQLGLRPLTIDDKSLDPFPIKSFFNEVVSVSVLNETGLSEWANQMMEKYQALWDQRIDLSHTDELVQKAA